MTKEYTTISVSSETVKVLKDFQKEFGYSSLDKCIINAIQMARMFFIVDATKRRELETRVNDIEIDVRQLIDFTQALKDGLIKTRKWVAVVEEFCKRKGIIPKEKSD